jgi:hypothetical protein
MIRFSAFEKCDANIPTATSILSASDRRAPLLRIS